MREMEFIETFKKYKKAVFTISDISKIIDKNKAYSSLYIYKLKKRKRIIEIEKGKYCIKGTNPFIIASNLVYPSYVSFISALSYYHLTTQIPTTIFVVSSKSRKSLNYEGYMIKFVKFKLENMDYKRISLNKGKLYIAEPEKAIIDSLYQPEYCPISEAFYALSQLEKINKNKFIKYAKKLESKVVFKRIGYLLGLLNIDMYNDINEYLNKRKDLLNPFNKPTKNINKRWGIIINEALENG